MTIRRTNPDLTSIRTLFRLGRLADRTDGDLLDCFEVHHSEAQAAFEQIVLRHGAMVLDVCRRVLRDPHDVDDAFQATFIVLMKRSGSIRDRDALGGWLHRVALRVALRAKSDASRRGRIEQNAAPAEVSCSEEDEVERSEVRSALHEELDRIPSSYRLAIIACYLEGLTHEEAASRLSWPVGTVRSRLARGRDRLRDRLKRRGFAPSLMLPALAHLPGQMPPVLKTRTVDSVFAQNATGSVKVLSERVVRAMKMKMLGTAATVALTLGFAGGTIPFLLAFAKTPAQEKAAPKPPPPGSFTGIVKDEAGNPIAGATVVAGAFTTESNHRVTTTDEDGRFVFSSKVDARPAAAVRPMTEAEIEEKVELAFLDLPESIRLEKIKTDMAKRYNTALARTRNNALDPTVLRAHQDRVDADNDYENYWNAIKGTLRRKVLAAAIENGPNEAAQASKNDRALSYVIAYKEGFAPASKFHGLGEESPPTGDVELQLIRPEPFAGTVRNRDGSPVAGAVVRIGYMRSKGGKYDHNPVLENVIDGSPLESKFRTITDSKGAFRFPAVPAPGRVVIKVKANGKADLSSEVPGDYEAGFIAGTEEQPARLTMDPEAIIAGQVVTQLRGVFVTGLKVGLQSTNNTTQFWRDAKTDAEGRFEMRGLPEGVGNIFPIGHPNDGPWTYRAIESLPIHTGKKAEVTIELIAGTLVEGQVVDADTGDPIAGAFIGMYGPARPRSGAAIMSAKTDEKGQYRFHLPPGKTQLYVAGGPWTSAGQNVEIPPDVQTFTVPTLRVRKKEEAPKPSAKAKDEPVPRT